MPKLSVIVPIYNTGHYLRRCIDSVLGQTFSDFELILVDDGSTDDSGAICDQYACKDERVRVIHKINEGVSIARNVGIQQAQGEFLGFADSDDWLEETMFEDLISAVKSTKADIVMCDAVTKYDERDDQPDTITQLDTDCILQKDEITPKLLVEMAGSACRCLYRRELLVSNSVQFPVHLPFSEDRIFNVLAFGHAQSVQYLKKAYYNRYVRKGSAVSKYYENMIELVLKARVGIHLALDTAWDGDEAYKTAYEHQTVGLAFSSINNEFYKTATGGFVKRYRNVKKICRTPEVRQAIEVLHLQDIRSRLLMNNRAFLLSVIAILLNIKYRR